MSAWTYVAGWVLVHFVWQGAVVALAAALTLRLCRRQAASVRYVIACGAMLTMLSALSRPPHSWPRRHQREAAPRPRNPG